MYTFIIINNNIFINVVLDYILVKKFETQGLVFATIGVNIVSMIAMIWILNKRLNGFPLKEWFTILFGLVIATIISGFSCWGSDNFLVSLWGNRGFILQLINLSFSSFIGLGIFLVCILPLKLPELEILFSRISAKFSR